MGYQTGEKIDFPNLKRLYRDDVKFIEIVNWDKYPNQPFEGIIKYEGSFLTFRLSHEFFEGNTYVVYDLDKNPIAYFMIYIGSSSDETGYQNATNHWINELEGGYVFTSWDEDVFRVGRVKTGQEFTIGGNTYKRVGPYFNDGFAEDYDFYVINYLPDMITRENVRGHQNSIVVQEKDSGGFFFAECYLLCQLIEK